MVHRSRQHNGGETKNTGKFRVTEYCVSFPDKRHVSSQKPKGANNLNQGIDCKK